MIDDSSLTQIFATVLVGVLIFLTLERRFEVGKENLEMALSLNKKRRSLFRIVSLLEVDRDNLEIRLSSENDPKIVDDYKERIKEKDRELGEKRSELGAVSSELRRVIDMNNRTAERYTDLRTKEGLITLGMIILLSTSIVVMILVSTINVPIHGLVQKYYRLIASSVFSIGVILLVIRVYLHGKEDY